MAKIGLFFGSFNPIHMGHLMIAQCLHNRTDLDQIWFVISPQNPFKDLQHLAHEFDRFDMVKEAIKENPSFEVSDIEFHMPKPSYTYRTLAFLREKHINHTFSLIIGEDNLSHFHKWENCNLILDSHHLYVYPRPNVSKEHKIGASNFTFVEAPLIDISASYIREEIQSNRSIKYLVHPEVEKIIREKKLYC